jgi:hypothetical protein
MKRVILTLNGVKFNEAKSKINIIEAKDDFGFILVNLHFLGKPANRGR